MFSTESICLLDDEPSVLKALGRLLASEGLQTETFSEPSRFLAYAKNHEVRVAVIDIRMPGMSGLEVLDKLREIRPESRVIMMTAEDNPAHRTVAMAGGAFAFFLKPLDDDALVEMIRASLSSPPEAAE